MPVNELNGVAGQQGGATLTTKSLGRAATENDVLLWEHGRRLGVVGDGAVGGNSALMLDRRVVASNRMSVPFLVRVFNGLNSPGAITCANAVAGDTVVTVIGMVAGGTPTDFSGDFEGQISVTGQIQQTGTGDGGQTFMAIIFPRS